MRHATWIRIALAVGLVSFAATGAGAASLPFTGTLSIRFATVDLSASIAGSGTAVANGSGGGAHLDSLALAGGEFDGSPLVPVTDPAVFPIYGLVFDASNAAGAFTAISGGPPGGGVMPLGGSAKVCLFGFCESAVANMIVPLEVVGAGGFEHVTGSVNMTVIGAPWTVGTANAGTISGMGFAHGPATLTSSTAQASGALQLVTPIQIYTNISAMPATYAIATLTLHFVPEPGTIVLLGAGIVSLAASGRRRLARR
jgi:hypothetical protein